MFASCRYQQSVFGTEHKFKMKNVKGESDVKKQTHIPYISRQVIINVPYSTDMGE